MSPQSNENRLGAAPVRPIVAPLWLGAERRGVALGARALLDGFRARWTQERVGDAFDRLLEPVELVIDEPADADTHIDGGNLAFAEPLLAAARHHADVVSTAVRAGELALTLGGDHALAFGALTGAVRASGTVGVLWLDTHPDLNTPASSPSGHMHGMPLGTAIGLQGRALPELEVIADRTPIVDPRNIAMLGVRDIDPGEAATMREHGLWAMAMEAWSDAGILPGLAAALAHLEARGVDAVHISLDMDVLDPACVPGTGTRFPGGLTFREASAVLRALHAWDGPIRSLDVVELNPTLDPTGTSTLAAGLLLATVLGASMLPPTAAT